MLLHGSIKLFQDISTLPYLGHYHFGGTSDVNDLGETLFCSKNLAPKPDRKCKGRIARALLWTELLLFDFLCLLSLYPLLKKLLPAAECPGECLPGLRLFQAPLPFHFCFFSLIIPFFSFHS